MGIHGVFFGVTESGSVALAALGNEPESPAGGAACFEPPSLSRSESSSAAYEYRASLSFASSRARIGSNSFGNSGFTLLAGGASFISSAAKISAVDPPANGEAPVAASYSTLPSENRSDRASSACPL